MLRALLLFALTSCGAVSFGVEQDLPRQDIQGSLLGGVLPTFLPNPSRFTIDISAEVAKRGTGPAKAAYLQSLTLVISPTTANESFDFLDEIHLFSEGAGLAKLEIARLQPVPRGVKTLTFEIVPNVDLLPYVNVGATLSATATATQPRNDTSFTGHVAVEVRI